jgi:NAD(P) transhydrogenase
MNNFDILIVGSGPAGQHAALQAAQRGKRVGMIERKPRIGGAGLQTGTIPSKALREVAYLASRLGRRGMREAFSGDTLHKHGLLSETIHRKEMVINQQESVILQQLLEYGVSLIPGDVSFVDAYTLEVHREGHEPRRLRAETIILATGSRPRKPADVPFDGKTVLDSTSILQLRHLPRSLVVIGGGVIGSEFVSIFAALGVEVTVIDSREQMLSYLSNDVVSVLTDAMQSMGVTFYMNSRCASIRKEAGQICTELEGGEKIYSDTLLYAQGRQPNIDTLNIDNAGIKAEKDWISVNDYFQTSVPHIYAVGDLIGWPALASTGMEQGRLAVEYALDSTAPERARKLPMAIYTIPELSSVGKTERELKKDGADYVVGRGWFNKSGRGQIIGDTTGLLKLNVDRYSRKILGVHIVGESASELIHIGQLVMNLNGTVDDLQQNVFNYPTLAECYKLAAKDCLSQITNPDN